MRRFLRPIFRRPLPVFLVPTLICLYGLLNGLLNDVIETENK